MTHRNALEGEVVVERFQRSAEHSGTGGQIVIHLPGGERATVIAFISPNDGALVVDVSTYHELPVRFSESSARSEPRRIDIGEVMGDIVEEFCRVANLLPEQQDKGKA